jgi:hypothetical protein
MKKGTRTLLAVAVPPILGTVAVALFLIGYLGRNKAVVTLVNETGVDMLEGQLRISSQENGQETGPIANGDSATLAFQGFSDGAYILAAKLKDGKSIGETIGRVAKGTGHRDRIAIVTVGDSLAIRIRQGAAKADP